MSKTLGGFEGIIKFYLDLNLAPYEIKSPVLKMSWVGVQSPKSEGKRR